MNNDDFYQAIDVIAGKKQNVPETFFMIATIKNRSIEKKAYVVDDGSRTFVAYTNEEYKKDDVVIILSSASMSSPQIIGLYNSENTNIKTSSNIHLKPFGEEITIGSISKMPTFIYSNDTNNNKEILMSLHQRGPEYLRFIGNFQSSKVNHCDYDVLIKIYGEEKPSKVFPSENSKFFEGNLRPIPGDVILPVEPSLPVPKNAGLTIIDNMSEFYNQRFSLKYKNTNKENYNSTLVNKTLHYIIWKQGSSSLLPKRGTVEVKNDFSFTIAIPCEYVGGMINFYNLVTTEGFSPVNENIELVNNSPVIEILLSNDSSAKNGHLLQVFSFASNEFCGDPTNYEFSVPQGKSFSLASIEKNNIYSISIELRNFVTEQTVSCSNVSLMFQYNQDLYNDDYFGIYFARGNHQTWEDKTCSVNNNLKDFCRIIPVIGKNIDIINNPLEMEVFTPKGTWGAQKFSESPSNIKNFFQNKFLGNTKGVILPFPTTLIRFKIGKYNSPVYTFSAEESFNNLLNQEQLGYSLSRILLIKEATPEKETIEKIIPNNPFLYDINDWLKPFQDTSHIISVLWDEAEMNVSREDFIKNSTFQWRIPKENTMIIPKNFPETQEQEGWLLFESTYEEMMTPHPERFEFDIRQRYSPINMINNKIYCQATYKKDLVYKMMIEITFQTEARHASNYFISILPENLSNFSQSSTEKKYQAKIYDDNLKTVSSSTLLAYEWTLGENTLRTNSSVITVKNGTVDANAVDTLPLFSGNNGSDPNLLLSVKVTYNSISLEDFFPIIYQDKQILDFSVPRYVSYDSTNTNPEWSTEPFSYTSEVGGSFSLNILDKKTSADNNEQINTRTIVLAPSSETPRRSAKGFSLFLEKGNIKLQPPALYLSSEQYSVSICLRQDNMLLLAVPLIISRKNNFNNANEDSQKVPTESPETLRKTLISSAAATGIQYGDTSNISDGVVLGQIKEEELVGNEVSSSIIRSGLFGFSKGQQKFALSDNTISGLVSNIAAKPDDPISIQNQGNGEYILSIKKGEFTPSAEGYPPKIINGDLDLHVSPANEEKKLPDQLVVQTSEKKVVYKYAYVTKSKTDPTKTEKNYYELMTFYNDGRVFIKNLSFWSSSLGINKYSVSTDGKIKVNMPYTVFEDKKIYLITVTVNGVSRDLELVKIKGKEKVQHTISGSSSFIYYDENDQSTHNVTVDIVFQAPTTITTTTEDPEYLFTGVVKYCDIAQKIIATKPESSITFGTVSIPYRDANNDIIGLQNNTKSIVVGKQLRPYM